MTARRRLLPLALALVAMWPAAPAIAARDARAAKVVADFLAAYEAVRTFAGRVRSETRKDGRVQVTRSWLWLAKPHFTAIKIMELPDMRAAEGTKLVWYGEPHCYVSTRFFGFPVKLTPSYDDPRLLGLRGWNMRQLSVVSAVAMVSDPRTAFTYIGADKHLDRGMQVVEARGPRLLPGIDRQRIWVDDRLHLPFVMEMWDGDERAYRIEIERFAFDTKLPADTFRVD